LAISTRNADSRNKRTLNVAWSRTNVAFDPDRFVGNIAITTNAVDRGPGSSSRRRIQGGD